jgi:hypothetical protein
MPAVSLSVGARDGFDFSFRIETRVASLQQPQWRLRPRIVTGPTARGDRSTVSLGLDRFELGIEPVTAQQVRQVLGEG